jgi:hypothetical protein
MYSFPCVFSCAIAWVPRKLRYLLFNLCQMLAASLGLKLFDVTRRILMYTKEGDLYKRTYAICRGTFPIHELCGTMTALLLARRDVLGVNLPQWQILGPAVFIHGMANFRGMKASFCSCSIVRFFREKSHLCIIYCFCTLPLQLFSQYSNGIHRPRGLKCNYINSNLAMITYGNSSCPKVMQNLSG